MRESYKRFVKTWIRFANPDPSGFQKIRFVDSFRDAIFIRFVSWIRFVDSFRKKKKSKRFVSFRFGRIRVRIPHP